MSDDRELAQTSTGSIAMAIGKLEAKVEEGDKQRTKLFELNERQLVLLASIDRTLAVIAAAVDRHDGKLNDHETRIDVLEKDRDARRGAAMFAKVLWGIIGGVAATALAWLRLKGSH